MKFSTRVTTKTQAEFWVRVFKLEDKIQWAIGQLRGPRKTITMPIIAEYVVDHDLKWVYALVLLIDPIASPALAHSDYPRISKASQHIPLCPLSVYPHLHHRLH
jgi:hypothetical protein